MAWLAQSEERLSSDRRLCEMLTCKCVLMLTADDLEYIVNKLVLRVIEWQ